LAARITGCRDASGLAIRMKLCFSNWMMRRSKVGGGGGGGGGRGRDGRGDGKDDAKEEKVEQKVGGLRRNGNEKKMGGMTDRVRVGVKECEKGRLKT